MRKEILKGLTMLMLVAAVALMAALVAANAQSSNTVVADIPFEFAVGGKSMKAGEYSVRPLTTTGEAVLITNHDDNVIRLTRPIQARRVPEKTTLVFHRYGQRYFLSEIWTKGEQTGRKLQRSSEERTLENELAAISSKSELARSSYETVEIIAMVR